MKKRVIRWDWNYILELDALCEHGVVQGHTEPFSPPDRRCELPLARFPLSRWRYSPAGSCLTGPYTLITPNTLLSRGRKCDQWIDPSLTIERRSAYSVPPATFTFSPATSPFVSSQFTTAPGQLDRHHRNHDLI